jgi:aspartyl-tRNA(Asn)/glutamyl-tRNA(Gln) amidotransferase subunit A
MEPGNDTELAFASIEEIEKLFRKKKLSPVELTKLILARIEKLNPKINAYITVTAELALARAKQAEKELYAASGRKNGRDRGPLHGIPISLKDNIHTAGIRTTAGSKILKDFVPKGDAQVALLLKEAGAVLIGKTNLHEFAYGVTTNNPHFGPTRNPWDLERIPGGSSGGSAAALSAGLCYGSIGTDTGGSIRIPASLCGVVGLKPARGSVSDEGIIPLSPTLDCTGPLARSARDVHVLFRSIAMPYVFPRGRKPELSGATKLQKLRVGLPGGFFTDVLSDEVGAAYDESVRALRKLGAQTKNISIPLLQESEDAGNNIAWAEATQYHQEAGFFPARSAEYGEDVHKRLEMGSKTIAVDYLRACRLREEFIHQLVAAMDEARVDVLAAPTTPIAAPLIREEKIIIGGKEHSTRALLLRLNRPANLAGVPAISFPCGFTPAGLPIGLQLIGRNSAEPLLLHIAAAFERLIELPRRPSVAL